jgi:lipid II:glycine glycyltransferase (peptidoglycan interpeptide bridge formation enzyme)
MRIDVTQSEKAILSAFPRKTQKNIFQAEKHMTVSYIDLTEEKSDDLFVLFYAFYKDTANAGRLQIPAYREMLPKLQALKKKSFLFFAYEGKTPIAVLWTVHESKTLHYMQLGSVRRGYTLFADYLLVWEAVKLAKKKEYETFDFTAFEDEQYPEELPVTDRLRTAFLGDDLPRSSSVSYPVYSLLVKIISFLK